MKTILVLNKIDRYNIFLANSILFFTYRFISSYHLDPTEAYRHLSQIIEQVNAILAKYIHSDQANQRDELEKLKLDQKEISLDSDYYDELES